MESFHSIPGREPPKFNPGQLQDVSLRVPLTSCFFPALQALLASSLHLENGEKGNFHLVLQTTTTLWGDHILDTTTLKPQILEWIPKANPCKHCSEPFPAPCFHKGWKAAPAHGSDILFINTRKQLLLVSQSSPSHSCPQITSLLPGKGTPPSVTAAARSASADKLQCPHRSSGTPWRGDLGQTSRSKITAAQPAVTSPKISMRNAFTWKEKMVWHS